MRVCLYLEAEELVAKSGFKRAFEHHRKALELVGVEVTTDPHDEPYELLHLHAFGPKSLYYLGKARREGPCTRRTCASSTSWGTRSSPRRRSPSGSSSRPGSAPPSRW